MWDHLQTQAPEVFGHSEARLGYLARRIPRGRVLNVGVGAGVFEQAALQRGLEVWALDPSESTIGALRERLGLGDRARAGYGQAMPFDADFFDWIVLSEVMEHLEDDVLAGTLAEVRRVLAPGGTLLGTVPARDDLAANLAVCPDCGKRFHRWGHVRAFTSETLRVVLERELTGVRIEERPFVSWRSLNFKGRIAGAVLLAAARVGVHGASGNYVFTARKP
jgi:SAM-dependent methyltransferase